MNVLLNFVIIFMFIMIVLLLKLPYLGTQNIIVNKFYLFAGIFLLQTIVLTFDKVNQKCKVKTGDILREASKTALLAVVGYSIYIDILLTPGYKRKFLTFIENPRKNSVMTSFIIAGTVVSYKLLDNLILPLECTNTV